MNQSPEIHPVSLSGHGGNETIDGNNSVQAGRSLSMFFLFFAVFCGLFSAPVFSQVAHTFHNPCERGPWPKVSIINESRVEFIAFLQQMRPQIPYESAATIAFQLCEDMSLVGDPRGLTARLNYLLEHHGYPKTNIN
jgi:hypothetical protein